LRLIDEWLGLHPAATVTDFLVAAMMEKLDREKIDYDRVSVLRDGRCRVPQAVRAEMNVNYLKSRQGKKKT
jgi:hypothetical protein